MKRALIIHANDVTLCRIIDSMRQCSIVVTVSDYNKIPTDKFDMIFIDPNLEYDPSSKINGNLVSFYDTSDSPYTYHTSGIAYQAMKDKVLFYAKMDWSQPFINNQKLIGYPVGTLLYLNKIAKEKQTFNAQQAKPFLIGSSTYVTSLFSDFILLSHEKYCSNKDTKCIAFIKEWGWVYNQRIDWLLSLEKNNISYVGGIGFSSGSLGLEWTKKYFGPGVEKFACNKITSYEYLKMLQLYQIGLNPMGHYNNSWRKYDIMATGAILVTADPEQVKSLYMPKASIKIKHGTDLGTRLLEIESSYSELYKEHQQNKVIISTLTPEIIWNDVISQF
jgi:hypothetical protein